MIHATSCPPPADLEALLDERLEPADQQRVSSHVAGCPDCQKSLDALTSDVASGPSPGRERKPTDSWPTKPGFLDRIKHAPPSTPPPRPPRDFAAHRPGPAPGDEAAPFPELPDYEILSLLGQGGEGVVYRARHRPLGRLVALKMRRDGDNVQSQSLARFRMEAETLARLQHPNIVQIYEVGSAGGRPFFAMEYIKGGTLSARLGGQPQPAREAAALVETLARAVHAAHQAGVVHRDLKPSNVLLAEKSAGETFGTPKISDFGLAKRVQVDPGLTRTGVVLGTPGYMAPEQARAEGKDLGPACDVYSLGSILYHLLTGRPPFVGERVMDVLLQVVHDEPVSVRRLVPRAPRDLETICLKCLQKDPRRRYATAEALADDLNRFLEGRSVLARPARPWERAWKAARRRPAMAVLLAACIVALLLLIGGGAYYNAQLATALTQSHANADRAAAETRRADERAGAARAAQKQADDEAGAAHAAERQARASAAEADRERGLALDAYEKLVFDVQNKLGLTAATRSMRQSLLKTAADGLKEVAKGAEKAAPDRARAAAHMKMGRILYDIGDDDGARAQFEACREVAADLRKTDAHDASARDLLCQAYSGLGNLATRAGPSGVADEAFKKEENCAKAWYDEEPDSAAARERLAESYNWLAGDGAGAFGATPNEDYNDRLFSLAEPWARADPRSLPARYYLAAALHHRGRIRVAKGDPVAGRDCFLQSKSLMDGLVAERPGAPEYQHALQAVWRALAAVNVELGEPGAALPYATAEAEACRRTLEAGDNDPNNAEFWEQCGEAFKTRAAVLLKLMRHEEAVKEMTAAVEQFQAARPRLGFLASARVGNQLAQLEEEIEFCKAVPFSLQNPEWVLQQPPAPCQDLLIIRVCLLTQQGREDEAEKAMELVEGLKSANVEDCYSLAHFLAGDMGGLTPDTAPAAFTDADLAMRQRFIDAAVAALNRAVDLGFHDADRLQTDDDLWVLRRDPGFPALVRRIQQAR